MSSYYEYSDIGIDYLEPEYSPLEEEVVLVEKFYKTINLLLKNQEGVDKLNFIKKFIISSENEREKMLKESKLEMLASKESYDDIEFVDPDDNFFGTIKWFIAVFNKNLQEICDELGCEVINVLDLFPWKEELEIGGDNFKEEYLVELYDDGDIDEDTLKTIYVFGGTHFPIESYVKYTTL